MRSDHIMPTIVKVTPDEGALYHTVGRLSNAKEGEHSVLHFYFENTAVGIDGHTQKGDDSPDIDQTQLMLLFLTTHTSPAQVLAGGVLEVYPIYNFNTNESRILVVVCARNEETNSHLRLGTEHRTCPDEGLLMVWDRGASMMQGLNYEELGRIEAGAERTPDGVRLPSIRLAPQVPDAPMSVLAPIEFSLFPPLV